MKVLGFFPSPDELERLSALAGPLDVSGDRLARLGLSSTSNGVRVSIGVDYKGVEFKFELWRLKVASDQQPGKHRMVIPAWDSAFGLFQTEWVCPDPTSFGGARSECPQNASAIGVAMVGLMFWDHAQNSPVGAVTVDHLNAFDLKISKDPHEIADWLNELELVNMHDCGKKIEELNAWLRHRAK